MPMVYTVSLATPGNLTTSGTPATETDALFVKAGVRTVGLSKIDVIGKGASLGSITGISFRLCRFATASTAGTAITPTPADPGMQAAKATSASRPTAGATRLNKAVFGCGAGGPGGWWARDLDSVEILEGGGALSLDLFDISGVASMVYELSAAIVE